MELQEKEIEVILKGYFSSKTDPSILTSIAPMLLDQSMFCILASFYAVNIPKSFDFTWHELVYKMFHYV